MQADPLPAARDALRDEILKLGTVCTARAERQGSHCNGAAGPSGGGTDGRAGIVAPHHQWTAHRYSGCRREQAQASTAAAGDAAWDGQSALAATALGYAAQRVDTAGDGQQPGGWTGADGGREVHARRSPESRLILHTHASHRAHVSRMEALFAKTTHPSREARQAVAIELHMDVRSVTVWLQNKRQSLKKAEDARRHKTHNSAPPTRPSALRRTQSVPDTARGARQWQRTVSAPPPPRTLPRVSLDAFANRSAPPHVTPASAIARPATPPPPAAGLDIWDRMPSSPHAPPSSPGNDLRRIAPLGPRRTLEWACAAERARFADAGRHGRANSPALSEASSDDTLEDEELRTPQSSVVIHAPVDKTVKIKAPRPDSREEDVAEIMLLFATQRAH